MVGHVFQTATGKMNNEVRARDRFVERFKSVFNWPIQDKPLKPVLEVWLTESRHPRYGTPGIQGEFMQIQEFLQNSVEKANDDMNVVFNPDVSNLCVFNSERQ